ncbi:MAG: CCA tRNA nucleotidyltransferase [Pseudooceanicola sp.]
MTRVAGDWLDRPATQAVCAMLEGAGHRAYFVGGCVRDAILGRAVGDIDIATDARPEAVIDIAGSAGLKAVPTGIDHGTVTVVSGGLAHEVTTFRRDVETDGRRAVVAFSDDVAEDARRRDFTMNAIYADARGAVIDPLDGLPDLRARRVRFIEDPAARIREDYLRILRFFRFHAWYGDPAAGMDAEALAAIAENSAGLETLSRERVGHEMRKLMSAPDPAPAVAAMRQAGVLALVLPGAEDRALAPLVHLEGEIGTTPDWRRRLAAMTAADLGEALRLSRGDTRVLKDLREAVDCGAGAAELGYRFGGATGRDALLIRWASLGQAVDAPALDQVETGAAAEFPVTAADLMPDYEGAALGRRLKALEDAWIASGFAMSRDTLLHLP